MKKSKAVLSLVLILILSLFVALLGGCAGDSGSTDEPETTVPASVGPDATQGPDDEESYAFNYSEGIDDNGHWSGIVALDYVTLADYRAIAIPSEVHRVTDAEVEEEVEYLLSTYATEEQVTDRAVQDGDAVNIDFVGSVDGKEFEGGNTYGQGEDVVIGVTSYIDDFLEQLIGHTPGETINVEVTFPQDYGVDELNGKDAVFVTTINYIASSILPELNDSFVTDNFSAANGWNTIDDMRNGLSDQLQNDAILNYLQESILTNVGQVRDLPQSLIGYMEKSMLGYYQDYADMYGMSFSEFISAFIGVSSAQELLEMYQEDNIEMANVYLVMQAVAEDAKITVTAEDVAVYFGENGEPGDYSEYEDTYGLPYLKQITLFNKILEYLAQNATLA